MLGVSQIGLSVTTMDDVFLKIGEMVDAQVALKSNFLKIWLPEKNYHKLPRTKMGWQEWERREETLGHLWTPRLRPG